MYLKNPLLIIATFLTSFSSQGEALLIKNPCYSQVETSHSYRKYEAFSFENGKVFTHNKGVKKVVTSDEDYKSIDDFILLNIRNEKGCYYAGSLPVSLEQAKDFDPKENPSKDPGMITNCTIKYPTAPVKLDKDFHIKDYESKKFEVGRGLVTQDFSKSITKNKKIWGKSCTVLVTPQSVDLDLVDPSLWRFKEESYKGVAPFKYSRIIRFVENNNQNKTLTVYCPLDSKNKDIKNLLRGYGIDLDCNRIPAKKEFETTSIPEQKKDPLQAK